MLFQSYLLKQNIVQPLGKTLINNTSKLSLAEIWHLVIIKINKPSDYDTYKDCIA